MPSWELFEKQDAAYKETVFPKNIRKRLSVEAASTFGWIKYVTEDGKSLGINHFGESAPAEDLFKEFGFTVENVVKKAKALLVEEQREAGSHHEVDADDLREERQPAAHADDEEPAATRRFRILPIGN